MGWYIFDVDNGVALPFGGPQSVKRRVMRKQTADKILEQFPLPFDLGPDSFELQITGLISPPEEADKLWEIAKRAESESITINVLDDLLGDDFTHFPKLNGQYAVSRGDVSISQPMFDANGALVQTYDIVFVQFAEQSDVGNGDSGDKVEDEPGVGFDLGLGDFFYETFSNLFPNLLGT